MSRLVRSPSFQISILAFAVSMLGVSPALATDEPATAMKIATIDMQKALQSVDAGKKAKAQLEKEFNTKKKSLQDEETAIRKLTEEFKKQSLVLSDEARAKKQQEIQEKIMKFQETTQRSQQEIQAKEQELTGPIVKTLRETIKELAAKKGYQVVLDKNENNVLFSLDKDDLTTELVSTYNGKHKG